VRIGARTAPGVSHGAIFRIAEFAGWDRAAFTDTAVISQIGTHRLCGFRPGLNVLQ
jgi:hypothetical protein